MTDIHEDIIACEMRVWDALVNGNMQSDAALLDEVFLGVYSTGFATKSDHVDQLRDGPTIKSYKITQSRIQEFGADHVLLSYLATFTRASRSEPEQMYVSSVWVRRSQGWVNLFSQDTPVSVASP